MHDPELHAKVFPFWQYSQNAIINWTILYNFYLRMTEFFLDQEKPYFFCAGLI